MPGDIRVRAVSLSVTSARSQPEGLSVTHDQPGPSEAETAETAGPPELELHEAVTTQQAEIAAAIRAAARKA